MKTVMFQGNQYEVPSWAKWIAQDGCIGHVFVFDTKPKLDPDEDYWWVFGEYEVQRVFPVPQAALSVCEEIK